MDQQLGYLVQLKTSIKVKDSPTATRHESRTSLLDHQFAKLLPKGFDDSIVKRPYLLRFPVESLLPVLLFVLRSPVWIPTKKRGKQINEPTEPDGHYYHDTGSFSAVRNHCLFIT